MWYSSFALAAYGCELISQLRLDGIDRTARAPISLLNLIEQVREIVASITWAFLKTQEIFEAEFQSHEGTVSPEQNRQRIVGAGPECTAIIAIWHDIIAR